MHKSPVSPAQLEANRRNAQKSTGPRTPAGKAASRSNATSHGLTGRITFQSPSDKAAYAALGRQLILELQPVGLIEEEYLHAAHDAKWQMNRCRALDEQLWRTLPISHNTPPPAENLTVEKLTRYLALHTRTFFRALSELRKQQKLRRAQARAAAVSALEQRTHQPYVRRKHGLIPPSDGFVLSASTYHALYVELEAQAQAESQTEQVS